MPGTPNQLNVLAAVAADSVDAIKATLGAHYSLVFPRNVAEAKAALASQPFQLIICGFRFDESRLVDLLTHCNSTPHLAGIPFVCVRVSTGVLSTGAYAEMAVAARSLGAAALDLSELFKAKGGMAAGAHFREFVAALIPGR
ncbi:MAG: hypothetical protein JWR22_2288 [Herminiimonas sp.]|nr:hypothetical protein [Herminiimonas sp.]